MEWQHPFKPAVVDCQHSQSKVLADCFQLNATQSCDTKGTGNAGEKVLEKNAALKSKLGEVLLASSEIEDHRDAENMPPHQLSNALLQGCSGASLAPPPGLPPPPGYASATPPE